MKERSRSKPARSRHALLLGATIVLIAFSLRTPVTSLGPVLLDVIDTLRLASVEASILTTIPSLCFGLFGAMAPSLSHWLGREKAVLVALSLLVVGAALRGFTTTGTLFVGQTLAAAGIGIVNVLLPGLVKRDFPQQLAPMTGLYTMSFCLGAAVAAGSTVPLQHALADSWSAALAFWTIPAGLATIAWLPWLSRLRETEHERPANTWRLLRDKLAWQVSSFMGLQSALAYIVFGWLAPILRNRGLSAVDAGFVLSLSVIAQATASLIAPTLATLGRDQRLPNAITVLLCLIGLLGCIYAPLSTVWLWSILLGVSQGSLIAIALTLIALRAANSSTATQLSGMAQGIGYLIASFGPLLAGLLHSWTSGWDAVAVLCLALGLGLLASGVGAGRIGYVRSDD